MDVNMIAFECRNNVVVNNRGNQDLRSRRIITSLGYSLTTTIGTNTYLIGRGPKRLLIDTGDGLPIWETLLKSVLQEEEATVSGVLLTHRHHDHVRGIPDLLKICPEAIVHKHHPSEGQMDIKDGQAFSVEGATLMAFHAPGHTVDHMVFILEEEDAMFTGDSKSR
jgi:endoribonuclease LACTB2